MNYGLCGRTNVGRLIKEGLTKNVLMEMDQSVGPNP
jgi:hypothetical protein